MPLVTIPLRLFGKSLKEYNFSVFTLPATFKPVEEFGMLYVYFYKDETTTRLIFLGVTVTSGKVTLFIPFSLVTGNTMLPLLS